MKKRPFWIFPIIVLSQFTGTSSWFAGNAILDDLMLRWATGTSLSGYILSAVQLGFILGTLCFAYLNVSDRFAPRNVFFVCSLSSAFFNLLMATSSGGPGFVLLIRGCVGFSLAGVYPVGMKIAAGWTREGLGKLLGYLVGALILGSAFPFLLKGLAIQLPWEFIIYFVSGISIIGGCLMLIFVPSGPFAAGPTQFDSAALLTIFRSKRFRASAFGYFGHMWELYSFLGFIPVILVFYLGTQQDQVINIPLWSFWIFGSGAVGCVAGGYISSRTGNATVAATQLGMSGICCIISPLMFHAPVNLFLGYMLFWGIVVSGDSPQLSTLLAKTAPPEFVGSALTIVNCVGFSLTIVSLQFLNFLQSFVSVNYLFLFLAVGPLIGLVFLKSMIQAERRER